MGTGLSDEARRFLLRGSERRHLLALDTMCFLYRFEANPLFEKVTGELLELIERGRIEGVTSVLTLTEAMTGPLRQGRADIARQYRRLFTSFPNLRLAPISEQVAWEAAELRASHGLRTPDALHLACALQAGADAFVTADARLLRVAEIEVLLLRPPDSP